jgi:hypothetical protein
VHYVSLIMTTTNAVWTRPKLTEKNETKTERWLMTMLYTMFAHSHVPPEWLVKPAPSGLLRTDGALNELQVWLGINPIVTLENSY